MPQSEPSSDRRRRRAALTPRRVGGARARGAGLDAGPHRLQGPVPRHARRLRLGAAQAADDVRGADGRCSRSCSRRIPNYKLNLIVGLFLWDFFAEGTKTGLTSLHARGFLLTKARCPSWILVVTSISNAVITLAVFSVIIVVFLVGAGQPPSSAALAAVRRLQRRARR